MSVSIDWERIARERGLLVEGAVVRMDQPDDPQKTKRAKAHRLIKPVRNGLVCVVLELSVRVPSEANLREHWYERKRRSAAHRGMIRGALNGIVVPEPPVRVTWTRLGGRGLDDDNLAVSFKHLRDGLAEHYGLDDRPGTGLEWMYEQEPGGPEGVRVRIEVVR